MTEFSEFGELKRPVTPEIKKALVDVTEVAMLIHDAVLDEVVELPETD